MKKLRNYGVCILFLCLSPSFAQAADGYLVQLGSFRSEDDARKDWTRIQGQQKDLLATMTSSFQRADLGSKGVFFRIHAGPLASESAAKKICAELTKRKVGCLVIKPYENSNKESENLKLVEESKLVEEFKSALEGFKKDKLLQKTKDNAQEEKLWRVSLSTGYFENQEHNKDTDITGKRLTISILNKLSSKDQIYGFGFGSTSDTTTPDYELDGESYGLGLGYSTESIYGMLLGGNVAYAHGSSESAFEFVRYPVGTATQKYIPGSGQDSYSLSINASKPFPLGGYAVTPLANLQYSLSPDNKPTATLSPTLNVLKIFSDNWLGSASVGGNFSNRAITLSGKKRSLEIGFGVEYMIPNQISMRVDYKRAQSGGYHSDSISLSPSWSF